MNTGFAKRRSLKMLKITLLIDEGQVWMQKGILMIGTAPARLARVLHQMVGSVVILPFTSLPDLVAQLEETRPDLVFNATEHANGNRALDSAITGALDLLQIPYAGEESRTLVLCRDKAVSKLIAEYVGFKIPLFTTSSRDLAASLPPFPLILKPRYSDSSALVSKHSVVTNKDQLTERLKILRHVPATELIFEQFIPGREIYIGTLGGRLTPPRELIFPKRFGPLLRIFTFRLKHSKAYRLRCGVRCAFARLPPPLLRELRSLSAKTFRALGITAYGRLDLRLTPHNEWYFIEANPNIGLSPFRGAQIGIWSRFKNAELVATVLRQSMTKTNPPRRNRPA